MTKESRYEEVTGRLFAQYSAVDEYDDGQFENTYLCVNHKIHVKVSKHTMCCGGEVLSTGKLINREHVSHTSYWYKPCNGSCRTELFTRGFDQPLPAEVAEEILSVPVGQIHLAAFTKTQQWGGLDDDYF